MLDFICYPKCSTCQKAQKWLDANGLAYRVRDIKAAPPSEYSGLKRPDCRGSSTIVPQQ